MTAMCSKILELFGFGGSGASDRQQFMILGLDGVGKSTLMYRLKIGQRWDTMSKELADMKKKLHQTEDEQRDQSEEKKKEFDKFCAENPKGFRTSIYDGGYHYEEFEFMNNCGLWDVPGMQEMTPFWLQIPTVFQVHGIFYIVDPYWKKEPKDFNKPKPEKAAASNQNYEKELDRWREEKKRYEEKEKKPWKAEQSERLLYDKKHIHMLMNQDGLHKSFCVVIVNCRDSRKKDTEPKPMKQPQMDEEAEAIKHKLGLHNLHESCSFRNWVVGMNVDAVQGGEDQNWSKILDFCKTVLGHERSFQIGY